MFRRLSGHVALNPSPAHAASALVARLVAFVKHRRAERQMWALSDAQLRDIGLSRSDISMGVRFGRDWLGARHW
jgi:uncharacterized protein YjiS (DUF1127 family)